MPATTYFRDLVLGHALLQQPFSIEDWYVGLWRTNPTAAGLLSGEVEADDYARRTVLWNSSFTNSNEINWGAPISDWGTVTHVAVLNSLAAGSGNMLAYAELPESKPMPTGQPGTIPVGGLEMLLELFL